jgi:hypothetical protein
MALRAFGAATICKAGVSVALLSVLALSNAAVAQIAPVHTPAATPAAPSQGIQIAPFMSYEVIATSPNIPAAGTLIRPNATVATFMIAPKTVAVLKTATLRRPRAFPESLPAGNQLFQVQVDNGFAYCAFWMPTQGVRNTQCLRDINNDGTFDASYMTYSPLVGTALYIGRMAGLAPMPPIAYDIQPTATFTPEPFSFRFLRIREGVAEFKPQFGANKRGFAIVKCNLANAAPCALGANDYVFQEEAGSLTVTSVTAADRGFWLYAEQPN